MILRERRMNDAELRALVDAMSRALESVHAAGALHLDVSPANVMCTRDGRFFQRANAVNRKSPWTS